MIEKIDLKRLPQHVAIIMDGNGRWARKRFLPRFQGHKSAVKAVRDVVTTAAELGLTALTLYAFSTENWKRPKKEISVLMELFAEYLVKELNTLNDNNIKFKIIGDRNKLPDFIHGPLDTTLKTTADNTGMVFHLAVNYGSRAEITSAVKNIAVKIAEKSLSPDEINESLISQNLYTSGVPDPDLIIRTSGEQRISNFLLWQSAYSEFYFTDILWPDFKKTDLYKAIYVFQQRQRRIGGTGEDDSIETAEK